ncbi:MAG: hypothetical protein AB7E52_06220 [Bdellovibrionales bacterium]
MSEPNASLQERAYLLASQLFFAPECNLRGGRTEKIWFYAPYEGGFAANQIDWRQSAKGRQILVRAHEKMEPCSVFFWLDPLFPAEKRDTCLLLCHALAHLLVKKERKIGTLAAGLPRTGTPVFVDSIMAHLNDAAIAPTEFAPADCPLKSCTLLVLAPERAFEAIKPLIHLLFSRKNKGLILLSAEKGQQHDPLLDQLCRQIGWPIVTLPHEAEVPQALVHLLEKTIAATR